MENGKAFEPVRWEKVLQDEHEAINLRRKILKRKPVSAIGNLNTMVYGGSGQFDTIGVALSGGGIRSAAFCLGALQALDRYKMISRIDYLSSVSGGGYTASAVSSAMSISGGVFPFESSENDTRDSNSLGHIRDYSNYLIPRGKLNLLADLAIVLRGLVTNVLLVLPVILGAAAITVYFNPTHDDLLRSYFRVPYLLNETFAVSRAVAILGFVVFALWAIYRSHFKIGQTEFRGLSIKFAEILIIALAVCFFCELQPIIISKMYDTGQNVDVGSNGISIFRSWIISAITYASPILAVASLFAKQIGEYLKTDSKTGSISEIIKRTMGKLVIWVVALALPVIIWMVYLLFSYWGIPGVGKGDAPSWLWELFQQFHLVYDSTFPAFAKIYAVIAAVIMAFIWTTLSPNANSLHRLYRDRLSDAFLFARSSDGLVKAQEMKVSELKPEFAPYHILNAALNLQGAPEANRRGRNADFFFFSQKYSGSLSSSFMKTEVFEQKDKELSLGTAMAISGAAISSNMGSSTIGIMAPTLALLNLRLGYWLQNPAIRGMSSNLLYIAREIFSLLKPDGKWLYLTDGGHIDNTGIYELVRRRCNLIIAIDAEADPKMSFPSFVALQRHARIDLGVRFKLYWDKIAATTLGSREPGSKPSAGPHCAIGEIIYSENGKGTLIYIKSSLTGDENVYVRDYARRNPAFPHETTGDQFFSEEQFEVYRALGFHCVNGLYKSKDRDSAEVSTDRVEVEGTSESVINNSVLSAGCYAHSNQVPEPTFKTKPKPR